MTQDAIVRTHLALQGVMITGFFATLIVFKDSTAAMVLVLLALCSASQVLRAKGHLDYTWTASLLFFGLAGIGRLLLDGAFDASMYERWAGFIVAAYLFLYFQKFRPAYWGPLLGIVLCAALTSYMILTSSQGRVGLTYNPISLANLMTAVAMTTLVAGLICRHRVLQAVLIILGLVSIYASAQSGTRGAYLTILMFVVYLAFEYRQSLFVSWKRVTLTALAILSLALAGLQIEMVKSRLNTTVDELTHISAGNQGGSIGLRLQMYRLASQIGLDNPVYGAGLNQQKAISKNPQAVNDADVTHLATINSFNHFHNQYLDHWAKLGFIGLASLGCLILFGWYSRERDRRLLAAAILAPLIIGGLTETSLASGRYILLIIIGISIVKTVRLPGQPDKA